jgi:hypothetical protein
MDVLERGQEKKEHYHPPGKVWKTIRAVINAINDVQRGTLLELFGGETKYQEVLKETKALEKLLEGTSRMGELTE